MIYGLVAATLWGLGDLLAKGVVDRVGARWALVWIQGGAFLATALSMAMSRTDMSLPTHGQMAWMSATAAANALSVGLLYLALRRGPATLAVPLSTCSGAVALVLAIMVGTARTTPVTFLMLIGVTAAAVAVMLDGQETVSCRKAVGASVGSALTGGVATWTAGRWIDGPAIATTGALLNMGTLAVCALMLPGNVRLRNPPLSKTVGAALAAAGGYAAFLAGIMHDRLDETAVLSTLSGPVAVCGAALLLKERPGPLRRLGLVALAILIPALSAIT